MKKKNTIRLNSILENPTLRKSNPYKVPDTYFSSLKQNLKYGDFSEEEEEIYENRFFRKSILIPAISLVALILISISIFISPSKNIEINNPLIALVDEGYLDSSFIDSMYEDIILEDDLSNSKNTSLSQDTYLYIENTYLDDSYYDLSY